MIIISYVMNVYVHILSVPIYDMCMFPNLLNLASRNKSSKLQDINWVYSTISSPNGKSAQGN